MNAPELKTFYTIKNYEPEQYPTILAWWMKAGEVPPEAEMLPTSSTFMLYIQDEPAVCVTLFLTNSPVFWIDNLVGNPDLAGEERTEGIRQLLRHLENFARTFGAKRLFCMSGKPSTNRYYKGLGFRKTLDQVSTFIKEIN